MADVGLMSQAVFADMSSLEEKKEYRWTIAGVGPSTKCDTDFESPPSNSCTEQSCVQLSRPYKCNLNSFANARYPLECWESPSK